MPGLDGSASQEVGLGDGSAALADDGEDPLGLSTDSLSRLRSPSVMEVREKGYETLREELTKAQRELQLKDEECERLSKVRDQLGQELEELTASLFEMDVLQAEVSALKTLVLSTSPTSPCKELPSGSKVPFKKGHVCNKSTSSAMLGSQQELSVPLPIIRDCKEARILYNFYPLYTHHTLCDCRIVVT
ncbi:hypothetical protein KOW79_016007 [Hemibagrus wyckioides]|uniref:Uncharacterized protein n=1 Tax=Hemibagrus wyckioides TaxID=337641 RepID=A0A9D3NCZ3_9TELE|nr:hypothetical protein KOW79_016007 [Hemibagrus wyckioides]